MCLGVVGTMCSGGLHSGASSVPSAGPPRFLGSWEAWAQPTVGSSRSSGPASPASQGLNHPSAPFCPRQPSPASKCPVLPWRLGARQQILCLPPQSLLSCLSITPQPPAELCSSLPRGLCHPHHSALILLSAPPAPFLAAVTPCENPPPAITPVGLCPLPCLTSHFAPQCAWLGPSLPLSDFGKGGEKHRRKVGGVRGAPLLSASKLSSGAG